MERIGGPLGGPLGVVEGEVQWGQRDTGHRASSIDPPRIGDPQCIIQPTAVVLSPSLRV